jgi:hypothetical protein
MNAYLAQATNQIYAMQTSLAAKVALILPKLNFTNLSS